MIAPMHEIIPSYLAGQMVSLYDNCFISSFPYIRWSSRVAAKKDSVDESKYPCEEKEDRDKQFVANKNYKN